MAGVSESGSNLISPFGGLPFQQAGRFNRQYSRPVSTGFGFGGRGFDQFQEQLASAQGPTAEFIRQGQAFLPTLVPQAQQVGQQITQQGQQGFDALQGSVDQFLSQLPNFQALMGNANTGLQSGVGYAQQAAEQAFSPIQSQALYQQASQNALDPARQASAARGLLDSGAAQQSETNILTDLAGQFAQQQRADQLNATAGLTNAGLGATQGAGAAANLAALGPQAQQMIFNALPQLAQALQAQYQVPMDALSQYGGFLASQQNPTLALLQATAPVLGQESKGFNIL